MKPPVKTTQWNEEVRVELDLLYRTMKVTDAERFAEAQAKAINGRNFYAALGDSLNGIPWWFIACCHMLECDFNFEQHLHNGDPLTHRTVNEPVGRPADGHPPFTFRESALDALTMPGKRFNLVTDWSIPHALWLLEGYNGHGYRLYHGCNSPYLWAGTNYYTSGKYVRDGVYSETAVSEQPGCAGLIKLVLIGGVE